jgi:hypothetical protein
VPARGDGLRGWLVDSPDGRRTEAAPWLAEWGLAECDEPGFPARARANVRAADAAIWFGEWHTPGGRATPDACRSCSPWKPLLIVFWRLTRPSEAAESCRVGTAHHPLI